MGRHAVAAPCGSNEKVWPPCSFSNKEPSKTTVWLPCSGHVQEQKRLPPRLANDSNRGLQGWRLTRGFMLLACLCLCGMHACIDAGSCSETNMTLCACLCHACLCLCCMRSRACPGTCHGDKGDGWNSRSRSSRSLQLVEAGPRVLTPERFPLLGGCRPRGSPRLWGVPCIV